MSSTSDITDKYLKIDANLGEVIADLKGTATRFWDDYIITMDWSGGGGALPKRLCDADLPDIIELFSIQGRNLKKNIDLLYKHRESFSLSISPPETAEDENDLYRPIEDFVYYGIEIATGKLSLNFDIDKGSKAGKMFNLLDAEKFYSIVADVIEKWTTNKPLKEQANFSNDWGSVTSTTTAKTTP